MQEIELYVLDLFVLYVTS